MSFSIIGTGSALPVQTKTNKELSQLVETNDEWIKTRTGIEQRHICSDETLSDLATAAAVNALKSANIDASQLDLIICSTIRGDYYTPSLSCVVQSRINATCPAFDVNAACSGFLYCLDIASTYFSAKKVKKVLVISAEKMSSMVNWEDRATCVLFGDGAASVVLSEGDDLLSIKLSASGNSEIMFIPNTSGNSPFSTIEKRDQFLTMNGQGVFKFAVSSMCSDLIEVINKAGLSEQQVDYILPHQANMRIIEAAQNRLSIPKEKYLININSYANISSVSIPLLLDKKNKEGLFKKGDILAMSAFGGGLTTGACVIRWNK
jgi:3-oxoacyl-[acyl-carrier-protein] synthase-3